MDEKQLYDIFERVYIGAYTLQNLPVGLYEHYAAKIQKAVYRGYRLSLDKAVIGTSDWSLLNHFRENVNVFCGARTFQEIRDFQNLILDDKGQLRPFNKYFEDVKNISEIYGKSERYPNWLQTEYNTSVAQGQNARKWAEIERQAETLPYLRYVTQQDGRVRDEHQILHDFVARVDDRIWGSIMPQNDWGCRCFVEQLPEAEVTARDDIKERVNEYNEKHEDKIKSLYDVPKDLFKMNPGVDKMLFKNEGTGAHPYFKVGQAYEVLKTNNFGFGVNYSI